jgi:hypothetical protein
MAQPMLAAVSKTRQSGGAPGDAHIRPREHYDKLCVRGRLIDPPEVWSRREPLSGPHICIARKRLAAAGAGCRRVAMGASDRLGRELKVTWTRFEGSGAGDDRSCKVGGPLWCSTDSRLRT